jgi:hypothetical protein
MLCLTPSPDDTNTSPLPLAVDLLPTATVPLTPPADNATADEIDTIPDCMALAQLAMNTLPPAYAENPAFTATLPPVPRSNMLPPDKVTIPPAAPPLTAPMLITSAPLTPFVPAPSVCRLTLPLVLFEP